MTEEHWRNERMSLQRGFLTLAALGLLAAATSVRADELVLSNGDRLTGAVVSMSKGKLQFNTALAGPVTVPWKDVASLVSETTVKLERRDDGVVEGTLTPAESGQVAVTDASGRVETVAMTDTHSIATPPKTWKGDLVGGMNIQRGNAERTAGSVDARLVRRSEIDRLTFAGSWGSSREKSKDGVETTTRAEVLGNGQYDYFFTKRLYGLASVSGEHDRVEGVDYRIISGLGLGYQFYDTENLMLNLEAGPAYVYESFDDGSRNSYLAARIAWNFETVLAPNVTAFQRGQFLPHITSFGDYLAKTQSGLRVSLFHGLFGEAKLLWDYNSSPGDDNERQDVTYQLGLGWGF